MKWIQAIDPFLLQLVIVPAVVIGAGLLVAVLTKRILVGPLVTLILNLLFETWLSLNTYSGSLNYSSWNIHFPIYSLIVSCFFVMLIKHNRNTDQDNETRTENENSK